MGLMVVLSYLSLLVAVLISVAFIVLLERSVLGYVQMRKGPNSVGVSGVLQSFSDAVKLFVKEQMIPVYSNVVLFYFSPILLFEIILFLWVVVPVGSNYLSLSLGGVFMLCCMGFSVFSLFGSGWSSNSSYAMLGAMRGVAQSISYEVSLALFFLGVMLLSGSFDFFLVGGNQESCYFFLLAMPLFGMWVVSSLAETNRSPFDFAEGESELVSGFNVEYGSGGFALLFLGEYASIIFMSYLMVLMFLGGLSNIILFNAYGMFLCFLFIWIRGTYPRLRYDKLMGLAWSSFLPSSLMFFIFYYMLILLP